MKNRRKRNEDKLTELISFIIMFVGLAVYILYDSNKLPTGIITEIVEVFISIYRLVMNNPVTSTIFTLLLIAATASLKDKNKLKKLNYNEAVRVGNKNRYKVTLKETGINPSEIAEIICKYTNNTKSIAERMTEYAPSVISDSLPEIIAIKLKNEIEQNGGKVKLKKVRSIK